MTHARGLERAGVKKKYKIKSIDLNIRASTFIIITRIITRGADVYEHVSCFFEQSDPRADIDSLSGKILLI